jgi:hypothetical protein
MMADRPLQARFLVMHPKTCARCPLRVQTQRSRADDWEIGCCPHKRKCQGNRGFAPQAAYRRRVYRDRRQARIAVLRTDRRVESEFLIDTHSVDIPRCSTHKKTSWATHSISRLHNNAQAACFTLYSKYPAHADIHLPAPVALRGVLVLGRIASAGIAWSRLHPAWYAPAAIVRKLFSRTRMSWTCSIIYQLC